MNYAEETVLACFRSRVGWLGLFLLGLWSAAFIIDAFEKTLQVRVRARVRFARLEQVASRATRAEAEVERVGGGAVGGGGGRVAEIGWVPQQCAPHELRPPGRVPERRDRPG